MTFDYYLKLFLIVHNTILIMRICELRLKSFYTGNEKSHPPINVYCHFDFQKGIAQGAALSSLPVFYFSQVFTNQVVSFLCTFLFRIAS